MTVNTCLSQAMCPFYKADEGYMSKVPYMKDMTSRLSYAVNQVAKYNSDPGIVHWETVQRILLYVYQHKN